MTILLASINADLVCVEILGFIARPPRLRHQVGLQVKQTFGWEVLLRRSCYQPVIGGENITGPTGHYPKRLAKLLADGFEKQFKIEYDKAPKPKDVFSFCS